MPTKIAITALAAIVLILHWVNPRFLKGDTFDIAMVIIVLLPWLGGVLKSIDVPGVGKVELQEIKKDVAANREHIITIRQDISGAVQSFQQTADASLPPPMSIPHSQLVLPESGAEQQLNLLCQEYVEVRSRLKPGTERTTEMSAIFGRMVAVSAQLNHLDMGKYLVSEDAGQRLAAYAFLYARPQGAVLELLVRTVAGGAEDKPFGQYWGIRAIGRVLETLDTAQLSSSVVGQLQDFCRRLPKDTDRYFELSKMSREVGFQC